MTDVSQEREILSLFEAMLDIAPGDQAAWLDASTVGRPAVRARLESMWLAHAHASLRTGSAADALEEEAAPERIGAYRITERIGRGGMGSVYRGERAVGDFQHVVAIKIIKPGLLSEPLVERFQRERQTLAGLSHPHIARLYDGGETEAGSPFIVMEHVDGAPLLLWVAEHKPSRRERQRLFLDIGAAVAFAHRNLVVHRDLTPSNVLVTRDGVVKLIDFGIAKPMDVAAAVSAEPPSIAGLSLTPGYAAPERLTSAEVTTAADIYSLGRLFQDLIAPEPKEREPRAIAARATALNPADRYPTVEAMLDDVRAWRDGFPVEAVKGGAAYRTQRFIARRPIAVGGASLGLALLLAALGVTLAANVKAEKARQVAEQRFEQTREIAKTMIFDAYAEVSQVPGSTKARAVLAQAGLKYLDALAADPAAPTDIRVEVGRGYMRLAEVLGGGQSSQMGKLADSDALLVKADTILRAAHKRAPQDQDVSTALAELLVAQSGSSLYNTNDVKLARAQAIEAQSLLKPIASTNADRARFYATAAQAEGDSYAWEEVYPKARETHLRNEAFLASLPADILQNAGVMRARSANLRLLGEAYQELEDPKLALATFDRALAINREVLAREPDHPVYRRSVAVALYSKAILERQLHMDPAARASIGEAVDHARTLRARDPSNAGALNLFATIAEVQAQVLADAGRYEDSYALGDEVIAGNREAIALSKGMAGSRRSLATALITNGANFYNGRAYDRACGRWREAKTLFEDLEREGAINETDRSKGLKQSRDFVARACNPPHAGLGTDEL